MIKILILCISTQLCISQAQAAISHGWSLIDAPSIPTDSLLSVGEDTNSAEKIEAWIADLEDEFVINLLFTAVTPCRIVDTRLAGGPLSPGEIRSYYVRDSVAFQGGNPAGCQAPEGELHGVAVNVTAVPVEGTGNLRIFPFGSTPPNASLVNYKTGLQNIANSATIKTCYNCGRDISIQSNFGTAHVVIDVFGYTYAGMPCTYSISPASRSFSSSGGTGTISVTSPSGCSWSASEAVSWITITSGSTGTGSGTVTYSVSANATLNTRTAIITVAGNSHTVTQAALIIF